MYQPNEAGASLVEYSLILVFAVIVVIVILMAFGTQVSGFYSQIVGSVPTS
jgi:Flp pilus assembly pilin Flp